MFDKNLSSDDKNHLNEDKYINNELFFNDAMVYHRLLK